MDSTQSRSQAIDLGEYIFFSSLQTAPYQLRSLLQTLEREAREDTNPRICQRFRILERTSAEVCEDSTVSP